MTAVITNGLGRSRQTAAEWVIKLAGDEAAESDWLGFDAWIQAAPDHRQAYDEALALWLELDARAQDIEGALIVRDEAEPLKPLRPSNSITHPSSWWTAGGMAALAMIVISSVANRPAPAPKISAVAYATANGEKRSIRLADGTRVDLGGASRLVIRLDKTRRDVTMTAGEAAFSVTHDPSRPFTVAVGDRLVRDVGTEFDIRRGASDTAVTVRQGLVQIMPATGAASPLIIGAGRQVRHKDGSDQTVVDSVVADDAFAWESGRLIYRDQPLWRVVEDLNRYLPRPFRFSDTRAAELRFTGVLTVDAEQPTLDRLTALLPVSATPVNGAIVIRMREVAR